MAVSAPDLGAIGQQLKALDHHVVIDPFFSESARSASVVLPGTTFAEESGTVTTLEGRVLRIDQAVEPIAGYSDVDVIGELAQRLDAPVSFHYDSSEAIFEEMRSVSAGAPVDYSGITYERIRAEGGIFWPCPSNDHPGTPQLYLDRFAHDDGKARFHPVVIDEHPTRPHQRFPLVLTTGRVLSQFLSGNQTGRIDAHNRVAPGPYIELHPATAAAYGIERNDAVTVTSAQASVVVPWRPNPGLRVDTAFMPHHWVECNVLVAADVDPQSGIPGFKFTPIAIDRSDGAGSSGGEVEARSRPSHK